MATRVTLAKKSKKYGALAMECDISNCTNAMFDLKDSKMIAEYTKEQSLLGIPTIVIKGKTGYVVYTSNTTDNYAREVTAENYEYKMALCPFVNQAKWEELVDNYFSFLLNDDEALAELRAIIAPALQLPPLHGNEPFDAVKTMDNIRIFARSLLGNEKSQGTRRAGIFKLITNKNVNWHFKGELYKAVETYIKLNTKKQWKK